MSVGTAIALHSSVPSCLLSNLPRHFFFLPFALLGGILLFPTLSQGVEKELPVGKFDLAHPHCDGDIDLDVKRDFFVTIANPEPGRGEYNEMVTAYQSQQWSSVDKSWAEFKVKYKNSPLLEAAAFLMAQAKFDRAGKRDIAEIKSAEHMFREAVILFPKSTLEPVITIGVGNFFLRIHDFQRALRTFEEGQKKFSTSPLACVLELGAAEATYQIRDLASAKDRFKNVLGHCKNRRSLFASRMRIADIAKLNNEPGSTALYGQVLEDSSVISAKYFQSILANLAEGYFSEGKLKEARYFVEEFLKSDYQIPACVPFVMKRSADLYLRLEKDERKAAGMYLAAKEMGREEDIARFSRIRALLIGLDEVSRPEKKRRQRLISEELSKIQDPEMKKLSLLENALTLLEMGEREAISVLAKLKVDGTFPFSDGEQGAHTRARILSLITSESEKWAAQATPEESSENQVFKSLEQGYPVWWKGTPEAPQATQLYRERAIYRFNGYLIRNKTDAALSLLDRWVASPLWPAQGPTSEEKETIAQGLARALFTADSHFSDSAQTYRTELALKLVKHEKTLNIFLEPDFQTLWLKVALLTGDDQRLGKLLKGMGRVPASAGKDLSEKMQSYLWLTTAEAYAKLEMRGEAESTLAKIKDPEVALEGERFRFSLYRKMKLYPRAFEVGSDLFGKSDENGKTSYAQALYEVASEGKLWEQASAITEYGRRAGLKEAAMAPFYLLEGRANFYLDDCENAVTAYEMGLKGENALPNLEAKFQLGKCLAKIRRPIQAKKILEEVVQSKDPTWGPLAQGEIQLLK